MKDYDSKSVTEIRHTFYDWILVIECVHAMETAVTNLWTSPVVFINPGGKEGLVGLGGTRNKSPERNKRLWPLVTACASSYCVVLLLMNRKLMTGIRQFISSTTVFSKPVVALIVLIDF